MERYIYFSNIGLMRKLNRNYPMERRHDGFTICWLSLSFMFYCTSRKQLSLRERLPFVHVRTTQLLLVFPLEVVFPDYYFFPQCLTSSSLQSLPFKHFPLLSLLIYWYKPSRNTKQWNLRKSNLSRVLCVPTCKTIFFDRLSHTHSTLLRCL